MMAQEKRIPQQYNPLQADRQKTQGMPSKSLNLSYVDLPFQDDFARTSPAPDPGLWADQKVFINSTYASDPLSTGVATFDALDSAGSLYSNASSLRFKADQLTSLPIRLNYTPADSIYLSFYFQPQGLGDAPEKYDSLIIEFYAPLQNKWSTVAGFQGSGNQAFRRCMIPVTDTCWLHEGFRFRFGNLATLAASAQDPGKIDNDDHWHIDYVELDKNRTVADTLLDDVAFITPLPSLLYDYEAVPWSHYPALANKLARPYIKLIYRNNYLLTRKVDRNFTVKGDDYGYSFITTSENIAPDTIQEYFPDLEKIPTGDGLSADFLVRSWITTDALSESQALRWNDTITRHQYFSDYYAYDDGSAENGYGITGEGSIGACFAMRYIQPYNDTLRAIRIYFNRSFNDANQVNFDVAVWGNNNGQPGELLHQENSLSIMPEYSGLNHFTTYKLEYPVSVPDTFYIGWIQTSETFLNAGLDLNRINNTRSFYYINGSWNASSINGTVMIRPVVGASPVTGINQAADENHFQVFPNPASQTVWFKQEGLQFEGCRLSILNLAGTIILKYVQVPESLDVSEMKPGLYIIIIETGGGIREFHKLLIAH
jgi:hypothetical protein